MKKIFITTLLLLSGIVSAGAWSRASDKAVLEIAWQNLTPKSQRILTSYIGEDYTKPAGHLAWHRKNGRMLHTEGWHRLHLDTALQPSAVDDNDALVQTEKALDIIRNRKNHEHQEVAMAIRIVMNLVLDMHNIGNVTLAAYPQSASDFKIGFSSPSAGGRIAKIKPYSWHILWTHRYNTYHGAYSSTMWAEELNIMFGDKREEYSAGTLRDWATDIGRYTEQVFKVLERENGNFLHATIMEHEPLHMSCLARAGFRLAALLNSVL